MGFYSRLGEATERAEAMSPKLRLGLGRDMLIFQAESQSNGLKLKVQRRKISCSCGKVRHEFCIRKKAVRDGWKKRKI